MEEKDFESALKDKKVPILVLDQKWHRLFALSGKPENVLAIESELNRLIERQGQLNNDLKDLKKLKNKLMDNIVVNMAGTHEENSGAIESKKLEEDKRLIDDVNTKIEEAEDELLELPKLIRDKNETLMIATMDFCYDKLRSNMKEADEIAEWISQVRRDLKKNIIKKQNREINNRQIYSYMHDIFGPSVINLFDLVQEDVDEKLEKKQGKKQSDKQEEKTDDTKENAQQEE
ncbi:MAG: hypothetical protein MR425_07385 [Lachnospiraceae bacterium]|nr:hypothetical protein [Lachnospiraceae bacterium]